jgi:hypothetical protein
MAKKIKICMGCACLFEGRRDAKTCSDRCRKRYQRARPFFQMGSSMHEPKSTVAAMAGDRA